jgi:hypothetical protein
LLSPEKHLNTTQREITHLGGFFYNFKKVRTAFTNHHRPNITPIAVAKKSSKGDFGIMLPAP